MVWLFLTNAGLEALNAKHPQPPYFGWSTLHFVGGFTKSKISY
jgi:hypothetical protein